MGTRGGALLVYSVLLAVGCGAMAKTYRVGDDKGWNFTVDYQKWASKYTFTTSDSLVFDYTPPVHSVFEVSKADYDTCSISSPTMKYTSGSTDIVKITAPEMYFICGVLGHCSAGMKLAISTSTSTPTTPTTSAPPKNGAASLQSAAGVGMLLVCAFLEAAFLFL